jgi:hypothetical protein
MLVGSQAGDESQSRFGVLLPPCSNGKMLLDFAGQSSSSTIASKIRSEMEHRHGTILRGPMHGAHQRIWNSRLLYATDFGVYLAGLCLVGDWSCWGPRTWILVYRLQLYARAACRLSRHYFGGTAAAAAIGFHEERIWTASSKTCQLHVL